MTNDLCDEAIDVLHHHHSLTETLNITSVYHCNRLLVPYHSTSASPPPACAHVSFSSFLFFFHHTSASISLPPPVPRRPAQSPLPPSVQLTMPASVISCAP